MFFLFFTYCTHFPHISIPFFCVWVLKEGEKAKRDVIEVKWVQRAVGLC